MMTSYGYELRIANLLGKRPEGGTGLVGRLE
jgi:hypothetical protein